ncbi:MAG TPA: AarF/ABC1/UbiB kinase family protein [Anaeromyxobacter sp.]|nr:AarF/ABC1/UbiB kinase family protein [Anaeromyxobacter sp.]
MGRGAGARALVRASSERVAAGLGQMKGLAMKVGQYLSFALPDLPPEVSEALSVLQTSSAPRPFSEMAAVIEAELGRPVEAIFRELDPAPVAAASIGQVHRGRLPDGTEVAVKVQYPDVAAAVRADLANAGRLARCLRLLLPGLDAASVAAELRERILEELDYRAEARHQHSFAARFSGHPFVAIPEVFSSCSGARVLTSSWAPGRDFAAVRNDPEPVRASLGEILLRFLLGCLLLDGAFVADPHPGNYRFPSVPSTATAADRITFLDFGCVKALSPPFRQALRGLFRAALGSDRAALREAAERLGLIPPGAEAGPVLGGVAHLYVPFRRDVVEPFPPVLTTSALRGATGGGLAEVRRELRISGEIPFVNRTVVGLYAVLGRLGASANWHRIAREYASGDPPSTPLGEAEWSWRRQRFPRSGT